VGSRPGADFRLALSNRVADGGRSFQGQASRAQAAGHRKDAAAAGAHLSTGSHLRATRRARDPEGAKQSPPKAGPKRSGARRSPVAARRAARRPAPPLQHVLPRFVNCEKSTPTYSLNDPGQRGHRSTVQNGSGPTDDDELDTSLDERTKKLCDVSVHLPSGSNARECHFHFDSNRRTAFHVERWLEPKMAELSLRSAVDAGITGLNSLHRQLCGWTRPAAARCSRRPADWRLRDCFPAPSRYTRGRKRLGTGVPRGLQSRQRQACRPGLAGSTPVRFRKPAPLFGVPAVSFSGPPSVLFWGRWRLLFVGAVSDHVGGLPGGRSAL